MPLITNYINKDDGTTTVVISDVELGNKETLLLDNGLDVEVEVKPVDPYAITDKQRRKIFALCNDIEEYTGQPREYMRYMFMDYVSFVEGYDRLSLVIAAEHKLNKLLKSYSTGCFTTTCRSIIRQATYSKMTKRSCTGLPSTAIA